MHARERLPFGIAALRRLAAATAALALCATAGVAHAQSGKGEHVGSWTLAGGLGLAVPNTDEYSDVLAWRVGVGYSRDPRFAVGLEVGRFETGVSQPEPDGLPNHDIASGSLDVLPVCLTVEYRTPLAESMATFSLLAGAGYYFIDYTMDDAPHAAFVSGGVAGLPDQSVHDTWGFHVGAGLEYALTGWFSVTVDGRYVFLSPEVSGTAGDAYVLGGSLDLNTWLFTGGIKVTF